MSRLVFNEDMIRRSVKLTNGPLPMDAFRLIHDIAYHVESRGVAGYVSRAQDILKRESWKPKKRNARTLYAEHA